MKTLRQIAGALRAFAHASRRWVRMHPWLAVIALLVLCAGLALWWLTRPGRPLGRVDGAWYRSQVNGDLYVGLDPSYPPFAEWTPDGIAGIEADIARELGRRWGVETSILIMGYDALYDALYTGQVDFLIAGLRVDPSRTEWVHYSVPYFDAGQVLVSRRAAPVQSMAELDGGSVAVELASAGDTGAQRWQRRLQALEIVHYLLPQEALDAMRAGQVDAALVDTISARQYADVHPDVVLADTTTVPDRYVIAVRKGDFRMAHEIDQALDAMHEDGTLDAILARWL